MENHKVLGFMTSGVLVLSDYCALSGILGPAKKDEKKKEKGKMLYLVKWMPEQILSSHVKNVKWKTFA